MEYAAIITAVAGLITAIAGLVRASRGHTSNAGRIDTLEKKMNGAHTSDAPSKE